MHPKNFSSSLRILAAVLVLAGSGFAQQSAGISDTVLVREIQSLPRTLYPAYDMVNSARSNILPQPAVSVSDSLAHLTLIYRPPLALLLKYDTSRHNPEHRCYDIRKPLPIGATFLFNFLASDQYNLMPRY